MNFIFAMIIVGVNSGYFGLNTTVNRDVFIYNSAEKCLEDISRVQALTEKNDWGETSILCVKREIR